VGGMTVSNIVLFAQFKKRSLFVVKEYKEANRKVDKEAKEKSRKLFFLHLRSKSRGTKYGNNRKIEKKPYTKPARENFLLIKR
jgi:hypothetical protein